MNATITTPAQPSTGPAPARRPSRRPAASSPPSRWPCCGKGADALLVPTAALLGFAPALTFAATRLFRWDDV